MRPLIGFLGLAALITTGPAMGQTPPPQTETSAPTETPAEPETATVDSAPEPSVEATDPEPTDAPPPEQPPPDGGPVPSEDRPSEPISPEDDLGPVPPAPPEAADTDDDDLTIPVQTPVPPHPDRAVEANPEYGRSNRLLDVTTELATLVARDGPFAVRPGFGGVADDLVLRGATGEATGDLGTTLDGVPVALPFAGRAVNHADLEHIPVAAIDRFRINAGPFDGSYAGSIALRTRRLSGVEANVMLGERGQRRLSLAAGAANDVRDMLVAVEARHLPHEVDGVNDERFSMLARASHQLSDDVRVGILFRGYRDVWDEPGTVERDSQAATPERDPTDGGRLWGAGAAFMLGWTPSTSTRLDVNLSYLDDRWTRFHSTADGQREDKNRDRVWFGGARLQLEPQLSLPTRIDVGLDVGFDEARTRAFATDARSRLFASEDIDSDWFELGVHGSAEIEFIDGLFVGALARADQLTVRREDSRRPSPDTRRELLPSGALWIAYRLDRFGAEVKMGEGHRTAPDAVRGETLAVDHDSIDLTVYGRVDLGSQWRLDWQAGGFGSLYEAGLISASATGDERQVWGAEARVDLAHVPSGLLVVARGGPWFSSLRGSPEREELRAPGVPDYVAHVGLLRSAPRGLVAEAWVDAYGGYTLSATNNAAEADSFIDVTARAGYRSGWGTVWIGALNVLDEQDGIATIDPRRVTLRPGRAFYAMLDVRL